MQPLKFSQNRGVAQPGSVLAWGARGRVFESHRPDQLISHLQNKKNQLNAGFFTSIFLVEYTVNSLLL